MRSSKIRRPRVTSSIAVGPRDTKAGSAAALGPRTQKKSASVIHEEHEQMEEKRKRMLSGMPASTRAAANLIVVEHGAPADDPNLPLYGDIYDGDTNWVDVDEEAEALSSEGGEYQDATTQAALLHVLGSQATIAQATKVRSHQERLRIEHSNWQEQLDALATAYLCWRHAATPSFAAATAPSAESQDFGPIPHRPTSTPASLPVESPVPGVGGSSTIPVDSEIAENASIPIDRLTYGDSATTHSPRITNMPPLVYASSAAVEHVSLAVDPHGRHDVNRPSDPRTESERALPKMSAKSDGSSGSHVFKVLAIHTFERCPSYNVTQAQNELANVSLIKEGLLGCSPLYPEAAFSLQLLELYHRLRRRHPRLGVQAVVRAICDVHQVLYTSTQRRQFSAAFDVYLSILRRVQERCNTALRRDEDNWRMKNSCVACHLELKGESPMKPERLLAIDGNNSAKRVATAGSEDPRRFTSDYFLPRDIVDRFKDEVKRKTNKLPKPKSTEDDEDESSADEDAPWITDDAPGEAPDGQDKPTPCTERWKASAAQDQQRLINIHETTGMFACACRHGFIQVVCEMVRSGELAKYPLAVLDRILDVHGDDTGLGYDIGCSFAETVKKSAMVGPKASAARIEFVVCAFHGYAHNRACQLSNHPLYRAGFGIEDLEIMERVFSSSNHVARLIRYASQFHYLQSLDLHFMQWDDDKYAELGNFILNNYKQCLRLISENSVEVEQLKKELGLADTAFDDWFAAEKTFLANLREEPEELVLETAYVHALITRQQAEKKLEQVRHDWVVHTSHDELDYDADAQRTRRFEASRRSAFDALTLAIQAVGDLEAKLEIDEPWTPADPKYKEVLSRLRYREFHRALDRVQQLVMQRLLELSKANMSGLGYKMRTSIWKGLKARAKAIRTALKRYNGLAVQMDPPAPVLQWRQVVNYTFVSEFDLLRSSYAHGEVLSAPWTIPRNREIAAKYFKIQSARAELPRLNRELCRLDTSIELERREYIRAIRETAPADAYLAAELRSQYKYRRKVQDAHLARIAEVRALPGFTGSTERGVPASRGRDLFEGDEAAYSEGWKDVPGIELAANAGSATGNPLALLEMVDGDDVFEDDTQNAEMVRLAKFFEKMQ